MTAELIALLSTYGLPALFLILVVTSAGAPFPDSLLLIAVGSFAAQGDIAFWPTVATAIAGAIAGDQIGYAIGYWGGRPVVTKFVGADRIARATAFSARWGAIGIFLSRWLVGPLGPWINITSGMTAYRWPLFLVLDVAGEAIWVLLYMTLGRAFSGQVQAVADTLGDLSWAVLGLVLVAFLGWKVIRRNHANDAVDQAVSVTADGSIAGGTPGVPRPAE